MSVTGFLKQLLLKLLRYTRAMIWQPISVPDFAAEAGTRRRQPAHLSLRTHGSSSAACGPVSIEHHTVLPEQARADLPAT